MATQDIWIRHFTRGPQDDTDTKATADDKKTVFTDFFGQFLQQGTNSTISTFDQLVTIFWNQPQTFKLDTYAIADGAFIDQRTIAGDWFKPHLRFISVVTPKSSSDVWKLYIVGPDKVKSTERFLQVASWDGSVFRFYAFDPLEITGNPKAWIYQGNSFDAFSDNSTYDAAYLGPFNGHVNGALIMKERTTPWYHWKSGANSSFLQCIPADTQTMLKSIPYLTKKNLTVLSGASVRDAHNFQDIVEDAVRNWYETRQAADFADPKTEGPKAEPSNVQRWMAHLLLTTTVNFATSNFDGTTYTADMNLFFNSELLLSGTDFGIMPNLDSLSFTFDYGMYKSARNRLRLCLLQEVRAGDPVPPGVPSVTLKEGTLGGGKQTASGDVTEFLEVSPNYEGVPFVTLQTAYEDAQGVAKLYSIGSLGDGFPQSLVSDKAIRAILMLDFWNPIYSWRRGVLMEYVPSQASLVNANYDLEEKWIAAIGASSYAKQKDSPEYQFLELYHGDDDVSKYQTRITNYLTAVCAKLSDPEGLYEYLCLAEAKRRIYRPLPLDEFGVQLPYALNLPKDWEKVEMQEDGTTTTIPSRGVDFFQLWTGSLAGLDPKIIPARNNTTKMVAMSARAAKCPVMKDRKPKRDQCPVSDGVNGIASTMALDATAASGAVPPNPTWDDNVAALFSKPYWASDPEGVGAGWIDVMKQYSPPPPQRLYLDLSDKTSVQNNVMTIYQHLRSRSMPITSDPTEYWPVEALETLRLWANQGFRTTANDTLGGTTVIPAPIDPPATMRVRKDILSLTPQELQTYREKLDDILQVGSLTDISGQQSKWQELGFLHAEWCLHYQEATFLWHRAHLRYIEELIDFPVPFWNGYAAATADITSPYAGLPSIFLETTYTHSNGQERPNPLRYALAPNGANKLGDGKYVDRYPELIAGPTDPATRPLWERKVKLFGKYHTQIASALAKASYSEPEGATGFPWANLPAFSDDQSDNLYPDTAKQYFDGVFEQAHDNYHGWVGPDMADNTYTAFDPIFLSYHCNMDRLIDMYLSASPRGRQFTSNFPLQPFIKNATAVDYDEPRVWSYTTIGDMAKDTRALQYMYAPPFLPDYSPLPKVRGQLAPRGGKALTIHVKPSATTISGTKTEEKDKMPYIVFHNVRCTRTSYQINVFISPAASLEPDPANPDFIGQITRIGMGDGGDAVNGVRNADRCKKPAVSRILEVTEQAQMKRLIEKSEVKIVVTEIPSGKEVGEEKLKTLSGFEARIVWG